MLYMVDIEAFCNISFAKSMLSVSYSPIKEDDIECFYV